jgi:hypothetical protein
VIEDGEKDAVYRGSVGEDGHCPGTPLRIVTAYGIGAAPYCGSQQSAAYPL